MADEQGPVEDQQPDVSEAGGQAEPHTQTQEGSSTPPWGDDFNPERAWSTIQRQRESESEWKRQAEETREAAEFLDYLRNPETQQEALAALGIELEDDEDPEYTDEEDDGDGAFYDPRVDAILEDQAARDEQQALQSAQSEVGQHVDQLLKEHGLDGLVGQRQREAIIHERLSLLLDGDMDHGTTEAMVEEWASELQGLKKKANREYIESKRAPKPPPAGQSGEPSVDLSDSKARRQRMASAVEALQFDEGS